VRDTFFISREIPNALPLDRFIKDVVEPLPKEKRGLQRIETIAGLARFVAQLHEAGLEHVDFHAGNILVQPGPRFFLVDMSAVRFGKPLSWTASRENLTIICAEWFDRSTFAQRWRFWQAYLRHRPGLVVPGRKQVVEEFDHLSREYSRRIDRRRDRRVMRNNRDFYAIKKTLNGSWTAHAVRDLPQAELEKLLESPDQLLSSNLNLPIKLGHSSVMVRADLQLDDGPQAISFKRSRAKTALKQFLNLFRGSRTMRGWRLGHALLSRRIVTPRPIFSCEPSRANWLHRTSYLATEWIDGAENLHLWCWKLAESLPAERAKSAIACARSLGSLVGRMHARQISHGDLKGSNILVAGGHDDLVDQPLRTLLIDLDAVRIHKRLPRKRQIDDLMRLATSATAHPWISNSLRRHFMAAYIAEFPRNTACWKTLWKDIAGSSAKLIAKKRKRGDAVL
jgi:tRNA A-37 threonylcarbamoyl transferase component Bud32